MQVGTTSGSYTQTAIGVTNTYTRSLMPGPPANTVGYFDPVRPPLQHTPSSPEDHNDGHARQCDSEKLPKLHAWRL